MIKVSEGNDRRGKLMATKTKRGNAIKSTPGWRGTCPSCRRTGVKLMWTKVDGENSLKVCKHCGK